MDKKFSCDSVLVLPSLPAVSVHLFAWGCADDA